MKNKILIFVLLLTLGLNASCSKHWPSAKSIAKQPGMLSDFENIKAWDVSPEMGFNISLSKDNVTEGSHSLKIVYPVGDYPSINTKRLRRDWNNYEYFAFDVFNPQDKKVNFAIRLDDNNKKKVNIDSPLNPGLNHVQISKSLIAKSINANKIYRVVLFLKRPRERIILYFDNMRLIKGDSGQANNLALQPTAQKQNRSFINNEVFEPVAIAKTLPSKGMMRAHVAKLRDESKSKVLVSNGVPFAPGQLFDENSFSVLDINRNEIPIAMKVLARWPYDNSIRSILVQFSMEIPHKYNQVYIRWGEPHIVKYGELAEINWVLPEASIILPAKWLCLSRVIGEQVPFGEQPFTKYDRNIETYYPKIRDVRWSDNVRKDGYYDTPHVFYQLYIRTGDDEYLKSARKEAVHYRDNQVIQDGPDRGRAIAEQKTRYIYVEALVDDYLLTGDAKSLTMAGYMVEHLKKVFNPSAAFFSRDDTRFWTEREVAFPFLGAIDYYELTGDKECLKYAQEIMQNLYKTQAEWPERGGFIHNLYSHDPEEGARKDEYGGSPFMTGLLLEAMVKYHQLTNSNTAKDSIFRALDWLMGEALTPEGDTFVYLTCDKCKGVGHPDLNMLIVQAFGYGYRMSGYNRKDYLGLGQKLFERGMNSARLKDRKHFNQNYRSSGHFLAYITRPETLDEKR